MSLEVKVAVDEMTVCPRSTLIGQRLAGPDGIKVTWLPLRTPHPPSYPSWDRVLIGLFDV